MQKLTRQQLKTIFKKAKHFRLPKYFDDIDFEKIKFLGWVDQTSNVAYTVLEYKGKPEGIRWQIMNLTHQPFKPAMCEICKKHRGRTEIMLITAPTKNLSKGVEYRIRGNYVCCDLNRCAQETKDTNALDLLYQDILT